MALIHASPHPLVHHKVAALRDAETKPPEFRRLVRELARLLAYEATLDLSRRSISVKTPLGDCPSHVIQERIVIVPILRAGLGMAEGILELIPEAEVFHIGLKRDEHTLLPSEYYRHLPAQLNHALVLIVDPMLATGGSAVHACTLLKEAKASRIKYLSLIAAPEGIARLSAAMPDIPIHAAAIDECLNEVGFIFPGLGDAGDRQFSTFES